MDVLLFRILWLFSDVPVWKLLQEVLMLFACA